MLIGIHKKPYGQFDEYNKRYEQILDYNKIAHIRVDINERQFWDQLKMLDLFIFPWAHSDLERQIAYTILPIIENIYNVKCFPDYNTW